MNAKGLTSGIVRTLAVVATVLFVCACQSADVDWNTLEAEGRTADRLSAMERPKAPHHWSDGTVELAAYRAATPFSSGLRLTMVARGSYGNATPFILDTGSSASMLSASAPLMREVVASKRVSYRVVQGTKHSGNMGQLPMLRMGGIESRDLLVGFIEQDHTLNDPANILGLPHFWHTQLEHEAGRWRLRSGSAQRSALEPGWDRVRIEEGLPIVAVRNPRGEPTYALIDTGAPWTMAVSPHAKGSYLVPTVDGRVALRAEARKHVDWKGLELQGRRIQVVLGMDTLSSREWRLTFAQSAWIFAPKRRTGQRPFASLARSSASRSTK